MSQSNALAEDERLAVAGGAEAMMDRHGVGATPTAAVSMVACMLRCAQISEAIVWMKMALPGATGSPIAHLRAVQACAMLIGDIAAQGDAAEMAALLRTMRSHGLRPDPTTLQAAAVAAAEAGDLALAKEAAGALLASVSAFLDASGTLHLLPAKPSPGACEALLTHAAASGDTALAELGWALLCRALHVPSPAPGMRLVTLLAGRGAAAEDAMVLGVTRHARAAAREVALVRARERVRSEREEALRKQAREATMEAIGSVGEEGRTDWEDGEGKRVFRLRRARMGAPPLVRVDGRSPLVRVDGRYGLLRRPPRAPWVCQAASTCE